MPLLDSKSTLSEPVMALRSTCMGDNLSVINFSFVSRMLYLLNLSDFPRFRTELQDEFILLDGAHPWVHVCPDLTYTYYGVSWGVSCSTAANPSPS